MISVRRTDGLPQTSFRFYLTADTLVLLAMCFPLTGALRTFTFKINARAGRTDTPTRVLANGRGFLRWNIITYSQRKLYLSFIFFFILPSELELYNTWKFLHSWSIPFYKKRWHSKVFMECHLTESNLFMNIHSRHLLYTGQDFL